MAPDFILGLRANQISWNVHHNHHRSCDSHPDTVKISPYLTLVKKKKTYRFRCAKFPRAQIPKPIGPAGAAVVT